MKMSWPGSSRKPTLTAVSASLSSFTGSIDAGRLRWCVVIGSSAQKVWSSGPCLENYKASIGGARSRRISAALIALAVDRALPVTPSSPSRHGRACPGYPVHQRSWRCPAGGRPVRVRGSARLVASVASSGATLRANRTQQLHGVGIELEIGDIAGAEAVGCAEGNMCGLVMREAVVPPESKTPITCKRRPSEAGRPHPGPQSLWRSRAVAGTRGVSRIWAFTSSSRVADRHVSQANPQRMLRSSAWPSRSRQRSAWVNP